MSEDFLHVANGGAGIDGMSCPSVAEVVRGEGARKTGPKAGFAHGFLNAGVEAMPPNFGSPGDVVGIGASIGSGEYPKPRKLVTGGRVLAGVAVGKFDGDFFRNGTFEDNSGGGDLLTQRFNKGRRDGNNAILGTLGLPENEARFRKINIPNAKVDWFTDPKAGTVEQRDDQAKGIDGRVSDLVEHGGDLLTSGGVPGHLRATGAKGVDFAGIGLENVPVKEKDGVECLILSGSGDARFCQIGKVCFHSDRWR